MEDRDLKEWNTKLEMYVQQQTIKLTRQNQEYQALYKKMKSGFKDFTITISNLIELRDRGIASHSNNVALLSVNFARKIGVDEKDVETIAVAAQLHDVGKVGISDSVLFKDIESLAPFEVKEYETHPVLGQAVVASNEILRDAGVLIRHHHEAFNGTGFPDRLQGSGIPLGSRIITLADTYDRLLRTRSPEKAAETMRSPGGGHFDPRFLAPFCESALELARSNELVDRAAEMELHPSDLLSGMMISRDVRSGSGFLLTSKGVVLTARKIDSIQRHYRLDPPRCGVYVWAQTEARP